MTTLNPEVLTWLSARSSSERTALFDVLARDVLADRKQPPRPIRDESDRTLGHLVPGDSSVNWMSCLTDPVTAAKIRERITNPGTGLSVEEFMTRVRAESTSRPGVAAK